MRLSRLLATLGDTGKRASALRHLQKADLGEVDAREARAALPHLLKAIAGDQDEVAETGIGVSKHVAAALDDDAQAQLAEALATRLASRYDGGCSVLAALARCGRHAVKAIPVVSELIASESVQGWLRLQAMRFAAKQGPAAHEAVPALRAASDSGNVIATEALWQITGDSDSLMSGRLAGLERYPEQGCDVVYKIGPPAAAAVPAVIAALRTDDWDTQWSAACALASIGPAAHDAVPALVDAVLRGGGNVPSSSVNALGRIGSAAVEPIVAGFERTTEPFRIELLLDALSRIGPPARSALPVVVGLLEHENVGVQRWAAIAHARVAPDSDRVVKRLVALLSADTDDIAPDAAALALGRMGRLAKPAVRSLRQLVRRRIPTRNVPRLVGVFFGGDRGDLVHADRALCAAVALARIEKDASLLPLLIGGLSHPVTREIQVECIGAIGQLGASAISEARQDLEPLATDSNPVVREAVAGILDEGA